MSQEILEALANENLQLVKMSMDHDSEISKEMIKLGKLRADFEKVLSEEEKEAFENMKNTSDSVSLNYATERFITGFRLGVMMMTEVFAGSDKLIIHEWKYNLLSQNGNQENTSDWINRKGLKNSSFCDAYIVWNEKAKPIGQGCNSS